MYRYDSGGRRSRSICRCRGHRVDSVAEGPTSKHESSCSICTGTFILASAGLLRGRRVATHWSYVDRFQREFPDVDLEPDAIYCEDGPFWTSAGVTAGLDMALALVERDLGHDI